jgi:hypothetical protein
MEVNGQLHAPATLYPQGKSRLYPSDKRLIGPQSRSGYGSESNPRSSILLPSALTLNCPGSYSRVLWVQISPVRNCMYRSELQKFCIMYLPWKRIRRILINVFFPVIQVYNKKSIIFFVSYAVPFLCVFKPAAAVSGLKSHQSFKLFPRLF